MERGIGGHNPEEVASALSSPDKKTVSRMKEMLKQFQLFLINFEVVTTVHHPAGGVDLHNSIYVVLGLFCRE